ncbi:MAG: hypothetical protein INR73_15325 [Williamsia sp.]|nr:hypothetical protein [Williamsia sp.]
MENFFYGSFNLTFHEGTETGYLAVHPEMYPANPGIRPSGNYFIYCIHPERGSCTFVVKQDENCKWFSEKKLLFISDAFVEWIGEQIVLQGRHHNC